MEYLINDGFEDRVKDNSRVRMAERLLRKALSKPHKPAVALMQVGCCRPGASQRPCSPARLLHGGLTRQSGRC